MWKREISAGYGLNWIRRQTGEKGVNDVSSFIWHLCMNVIMCKYLQAPNRNPRNLRSLCITLWEYMFWCTEIKLCLGRSIMLFKRYNIPRIWLKACTKLSPLLFLYVLIFLFIFFTYATLFSFFTHLVTAPPMCCVQINKCSSLYDTTFLAISYCSQIICDKSVCLKQGFFRTMFYPKKPPWWWLTDWLTVVHTLQPG